MSIAEGIFSFRFHVLNSLQGRSGSSSPQYFAPKNCTTACPSKLSFVIPKKAENGSSGQVPILIALNYRDALKTYPFPLADHDFSAVEVGIFNHLGMLPLTVKIDCSLGRARLLVSSAKPLFQHTRKGKLRSVSLLSVRGYSGKDLRQQDKQSNWQGFAVQCSGKQISCPLHIEDQKTQPWFQRNIYKA